jgi:hypothetical protein
MAEYLSKEIKNKFRTEAPTNPTKKALCKRQTNLSFLASDNILVMTSLGSAVPPIRKSDIAKFATSGLLLDLKVL